MTTITSISKVWKKGDAAWLALNDCFGSKLPVRVLKLCKDGTVHLTEESGSKKIVNHVNNLTHR